MYVHGVNLRENRATWGFVGLLWSLVACGPSLPTAPIEPTAFPGFESSPMPERPGIEEREEQGPEELYPGDLVSIQVVGEPSPSPAPTPVDRSGYVHLGLLGSVKVAGLPIHEAEAQLQKAMRRLDRFSQVSLSLVDGRGRHASVLGAVEHPGHIALQGDMRLADVLAVAGGPRSTTQEDRLVTLGDPGGLRLVRKGQTLPIDGRLALEGHPRHNIRIFPGDTIHVPPAVAARVLVMGNVGRARSMAFHPGMRLTEALAEAGGLSSSADAADVRIVRGGYAAPQVYVASPKALFAGRSPDVLLAPGDVIYVTEHWIATAGQVLERLIPTLTTGLLLNSAVNASR